MYSIKLSIIFCILLVINYIIFKNEKKRARNSNIELLRIVAMLLVVMHHFAYHGYNIKLLELSECKLLLDFFVLGGKIGVNIFIIISCYYLIEKKYSRIGILKLILSVKSYALIFFIMAIIFKEKITSLDALRSLFPILYQLYWFITGYVLLYMVAPFLNEYLYKINKKQLKRLIALCVIVYVFINNFLGAKLFLSSLIWFVILYIITYYLKCYLDFMKINTKTLLMTILLCYMAIYMSVVTFDILGIEYNIFRKNMLYFIGENSLFAVIISFGVFLIFVKLKTRSNRLINYIGSGTMGIYLIHENIFVRPILYNNLSKNSGYIDANFSVFFLHSVGGICSLFCGCLLIGKIIDCVINNTVFKIINLDKIVQLFIKIENNLLTLFDKYEK